MTGIGLRGVPPTEVLSFFSNNSVPTQMTCDRSPPQPPLPTMNLYAIGYGPTPFGILVPNPYLHLDEQPASIHGANLQFHQQVSLL
jgi:hypothetical protein